MPFPFLPGGALLAIGVLSGAYVVFAVAIRASDRALAGLRSSMLPAVVSGLRTWREAVTPPEPASPAGPAGQGDQAADAVEVIELHPDRDRAD